MKTIKIVLSRYTAFVSSAMNRKLKLDDRLELILMSKSNGFDLTSKNLKHIECDVIINLAAKVSIEESRYEPHTVYKNNY